MPTWMDGILKHCGSAAVTLALALVVPGALNGAGQVRSKFQQSEIVQQLSSENWNQRSEAVAALRSVPVKDWSAQVRDSLIRVFGMEEGRLYAKLEGSIPPSSFPEMGHEAFAEYYSALAGLVMKLNDPRALPLIVNFATSPDPRILGYVAQRGSSALPLVLNRLNRARQRSDVGPEWAMLDTLTELVLLNREGRLQQPLSSSEVASLRTAALRFLDDPNPWVATHAARTLAAVADSHDQERVREIFARLLRDPDHNRREIALSAMRGITNPRFVPVGQLKLVASQDPFRLAGPTAHYSAGAYPLRHEAAQILKSLDAAR